MILMRLCAGSSSTTLKFRLQFFLAVAQCSAISALRQRLWQCPACSSGLLGVRRKLHPMVPPSLCCASQDCIPQSSAGYVMAGTGEAPPQSCPKVLQNGYLWAYLCKIWGAMQVLPPQLLSPPGKSLIFIIKMIKYSK